MQITARCLHNAALVRSGQHPYKDTVFVLSPFLGAFCELAVSPGLVARRRGRRRPALPGCGLVITAALQARG